MHHKCTERTATVASGPWQAASGQLHRGDSLGPTWDAGVMTTPTIGSGPLQGRVALVTGVSRPAGIAATVASRLHLMGAHVFASGWPAHDNEMPWGGADLPMLPFPVEQRNLADAVEATALVDAVVERYGAIDIVAAVHARSSSGTLDEVDAAELDLSWAVNVRSIVLLPQRFAQRHVSTSSRSGRMVWFTSGQHLESMHSELAYAISKGALHQMTASLAVPLGEAGIMANCINPGPVDTGYAFGEQHTAVAKQFPSGRWGTPVDVANLVAFLVSDEGAWITGQVLNSEGGFRRSS
jgi:3-oxoacyl-[acyl-carrier protein] reductase